MSGGVKRWTVSEIERENFEPHTKGFVLASDFDREMADRNAQIYQRDNVITELKVEINRLAALAHNTTPERRDLSFLKIAAREKTIAQKDRVITKLTEQRNEAIRYDLPLGFDACDIIAKRDAELLEGE